MLKRKKIEIQEEERKPLVLAHSDNASILAASSNGLVPKCHRTSAPDHQRQLTADIVCTMHGCSLEADK